MGYVIRCSSLGDYPDCPKKAAAKLFADDIIAAGFKLMQTLPSIGAAIGTGIHKAAAKMLVIKRDERRLATVSEVMPKAVEEFEAEIKGGYVTDQATGDVPTAMKQIREQSQVYQGAILPKISPVLVEQKVSWDLGDDYVVEGTFDAFDGAGFVHDLKTGTRDKNHLYQLGGYVKGLQAAGHEVNGAQIDWIKRVGKTKSPEMPKYETYDIKKAAIAAEAVAHRIKRDHELFMKTGNQLAFLPNPNTVLCSAKYCPAWGTNFCDLWREKKGDQE